jgi:uncharacterized membrane protein
MHAAVAVPDPGDLPLTAAIARPARLCYELFCEAERIPEWIPVIRSAHVNERNYAGRPVDVGFFARLARATIGYRVRYLYRERDFGVSWSTVEGAGVLVAGWAQFTPLDGATALLTYQLTLDLGGAMAEWDDPFFEGHAPSAVMSDFRDYALRAL